jgi:hypothetical protein
MADRNVERLTALLFEIKMGRKAQNAHIQDEGISHDVDEKKGEAEVARGISHDVNEKKAVNM